jgi:hypothetical protein
MIGALPVILILLGGACAAGILIVTARDKKL